jgi:SAM-dependent methyltransferase
VRDLLDGGQVDYLKGLAREKKIESILDVCCGTGHFSTITDGDYVGIDYNRNFIDFCMRRFSSGSRKFFFMDATNIDAGRTFDAAIIINSIHHFPDEEVVKILASMKRSAKTVIVHDLLPQDNPVTRFFYGRDRGQHIRALPAQEKLIGKAGLKIRERRTFRRFPWIYLHSTLVCSKA